MSISKFGRPGLHITSGFERAPDDIVKKLGAFPVSILCDALGHRGVMDAGIEPILPNATMAGQALTVATRPADNLFAHVALKLAGPGDVIVIDAKGDQSCAIWGDLMARHAIAKGVAGLIVDGPVRDRAELIELNWPVYSRGVNPRGPEKDGPGEVNSPIACGGVPINPGDIIIGDGDGIIAIPQDMAEAAIELATARVAAEQKYADAIASGDDNPFGVIETLREKGLLGEDETL